MLRPPDISPEELDRACKLARVPDLLCVPVVARVLARCLLLTKGCTEDTDEERTAALSRARDVARLGSGHPLWRTAPDQARALVLRLLELDGTKLQPWNAAGLAYYALELTGSTPKTPAEYVERFRRWHALWHPSLIETVLLAMDCAGRISPTSGVSMHLMGRAAKPLRMALIEPYQERLGGSWERALTWSFSEYTLESLSYFVLNLASTSTALSYKLYDLAVTVRQALDERDQAISARDLPQGEEVERRTEIREEERIREAERRLDAANLARERAVGELRAVQSERELVAARLARAQSRIESLEAQLAHRHAQSSGKPADSLTSLPAGPVSATTPIAPPPPPTLTGEYVLVFTNQQRAGVRESIRTAFVALGATTVEVIDVSRSHGPDVYPQNAVIAIDITSMSHADHDTVKARATRAGCRFVQLRGGSATLAERTAERLAAGRG